MTNTKKEEKALTVKELMQNDNYIIPIYQRNYAWGKTEIEMLIDDISNAIEKNLENYYIGTLVVYKKDEKTFEIIDGQQRHTTLSLIQATIQNIIRNDFFKIEKSNLSYEARQESKTFFENLYTDFDRVISQNNTFTYAIKQIIEPKLNSLQNKDVNKDENKDKYIKWCEYFYNKVKFFRVEVPKDTDLHHYFETMNNRGEQLEETEVLKAKFMSNLSPEEQVNFSNIWDKCADMFSYNKIENKKENEFEDLTLDKLLIGTKSKISNSEEFQKLLTKKQNDDKPEEPKVQSIINFPNFLLIVLKLLPERLNVSLNEKNLLKEFRYFEIEYKLPDSNIFIKHLEKCRILFDDFFIKRNFEDTKPYWVLEKDAKNTFTNEEVKEEDDENQKTDNKSLQDKMVKIQSMLQSVYFSNINKNWLYEGMKVILENISEKSNIEIGNLLYDTLFNFAKDKFIENIDNNNLPKDTGLNISHIVFYFTDYLLWLTYYEDVRGKKSEELNKEDKLLTKIDNVRDKFSKFHFKQNSSIEHLYPQNPEKQNEKITDKFLHSFGNLCLVSRSANSRYSNFMPDSKRKELHKNNESLKQLIMFQSFENDKWGEDQIQSHQEEMIKLLEKHYN